MRLHITLGFALLLGATTPGEARSFEGKSPSPSSSGQDRPVLATTIKQYSGNYLRCLNSSVPGIVEAALGHVTYMRIAYLEADLKELREKISDLALRGSTFAIRYKAFTASEVFSNPARFTATIAGRSSNGDGLLEEIGVILSSSAVTAANEHQQ